MEEKYASIRGIYRDVLKDQNSNVIFDSGWVSNLIVDRCRILLAAFMKNDQNKQTWGISCLKVGQGDEDWDNKGTESPNVLLEGLVDPAPFIIDVADLDIVYLNETNAEVTEPTCRIQVTATLGTDQPPPPPSETPETQLSTYPLREFGLFGKFGDEDYMIDCIRHPVIHKDVSTTLIRVVRLYF
ncbi:MAG: hypothetical protein GTO45_08940 [Candidatus Aminicenantes bacterium]|nr:hypothetical protein [Candidatus Aminicenantes bacterium]NIM78958.1 hypothetical protein [Candidatus Aminicenantes bacterium]NIN18822.1 hypothetical protein [Candidatus Aminicenantes bacterium]NIN42744.1 hypothetical protein [Candidatus Aminicenantes bacterium]NIN84870.1 hypothetical protein [Candidatus Aminicenantes bacterium]